MRHYLHSSAVEFRHQYRSNIFLPGLIISQVPPRDKTHVNVIKSMLDPYIAASSVILKMMRMWKLEMVKKKKKCG